MTRAYVRKIKKWMFCPACQNGKMAINKKSTMWTCEECGYQLSTDEFEDGYVFWFCDECHTYLNNQEGFDKHAARHICKKCGYENDTTLDNVKVSARIAERLFQTRMEHYASTADRHERLRQKSG